MNMESFFSNFSIIGSQSEEQDTEYDLPILQWKLLAKDWVTSSEQSTSH